MTQVTQPSVAPNARSILFVDDDPLVLDGLRDALRPRRARWTMSFVLGGDAAIRAMEATTYDLIVSDLRMPGLDGAALLERARQQSPTTVRVILSGHADMRMVARAAGAAHRLLAKPCDSEELAMVIERSCALRDIGTRVELDSRAIGASSLPSVPRLYTELTELLSTGGASAADVGRVVEKDIAMSAKVLQLANSAYFGRRSPTADVVSAVSYLGIDTLRALLLHAEAFRAFRLDQPIPGFDLNALHDRCTRVARLANNVLKDSGSGGNAFTAGLLHDIGLLILAAQGPDELAATLADARETGRPIHTVEREQHGITHAEVGAHLLALWGVPHDVTEAVAGHHNPDWLSTPLDAVAAVQIAAALVEEDEAGIPSNEPVSDPHGDYLSQAGLLHRLSHWRQLAARHATARPG